MHQLFRRKIFQAKTYRKAYVLEILSIMLPK